MSETYRKRGSTVRWENGVVVHVSESGMAIEDGDVFTCQPERSEGPPAIEAANVIERAQIIQSLIPPPLRIERLLITEGIAEHECDGRVWSETARRIHLSIVHERVRLLLEREDDIESAVAALRRCGEERDAPPRLRLAPSVAAALTPALLQLAPPNIRVAQTAGGVDGKGFPIMEATGDWPNWYRPSYRVRPVRIPLNLRVTCDVTEIERDRPVAVALLAPPDALVLRVLVDDGQRAWPCTVRVARIDAVADEAVWYPYGGGSFGAEMML
jgi:hypothetical protein